MSLTTDPNDPRLGHGIDDEPVAQNEVYLVLSSEEISKGFVRPVRNSYVHVGKKMSYFGIHRMLDEKELIEYADKKYVAVMTLMKKEDGSFLGGPYVTQEAIDAWKAGKRLGGCGVTTTMGQQLSETYARNPRFYGSTYCTGCRKHLDVSEFFWNNTEEPVGS